MTTVCEKKSHLGLNLLYVDLLLSAQLQHLRTEQQVTVHVQIRFATSCPSSVPVLRSRAPRGKGGGGSIFPELVTVGGSSSSL